MNKKPLLPRIFFLSVLYGAVFIILVMIQFSRYGGFTRRIGDFTVSGHYREAEKRNIHQTPGEESLLEGGASVFFGGMEFRLHPEDTDGFALIREGGAMEHAFPRSMSISGETVQFRLPDGSILNFGSRYAGGREEIRISAELAEGTAALELPWRPQKNSSIREEGDGEFSILIDGAPYHFDAANVDPRRRVLVFLPDATALSYGPSPEKTAFNPADLTLPEGEEEAYNGFLSRWRDRNFSLWSRNMAGRKDEETAMAYAGEALERGNYKAAVSAISANLPVSGRTYRSAPYLGQLENRYRSLVDTERETISRISRMINEKSPDFLKELHVFAFLAVRGYGNFIDDAAKIILALDPSTLNTELAPGVFEGWSDWNAARPNEENPFYRLVDQACYVVSEDARKNAKGDKVFVFSGGRAGTEYNLRLGAAMLDWAESAEEAASAAAWAGFARSLVVSVLALDEGAGNIPAAFETTEEAAPADADGPSPARLYRILSLGNYRPRAVPLGAGVNSLWAWTAAGEVTVSQTREFIDIAVSFPVGEAHYMLIKGLKPFSRLQLYNMDYRTDPQFERYDSSGWVYRQGEQMLLLKMKHRSQVEHVKIFY